MVAKSERQQSPATGVMRDPFAFSVTVSTKGDEGRAARKQTESQHSRGAEPESRLFHTAVSLAGSVPDR